MPKLFVQTLKEHSIELRRGKITTLQVNIGWRCNQACHHCHVEAGPNRTENMDKNVIERLLYLLQKSPDIETVDITGGAPELNPYFREFVLAIRSMGKTVIDRCNLTVLYEKGQEATATFLADNNVQIVASLPCYSRDNVETQRGKGVFGKSIDGLLLLNGLGYAQEGSGLTLNLVYNPNGAFLPGDQAGLEIDYKQHLKEDFGIFFNNLYTITNMPIKRFAHYLEREGKMDEYMQLLIDNFNPLAAHDVMCKNLVSVRWDGQIYDCDFNQMLELPVGNQKTSIFDIENFEDVTSKIAVREHCYGCTAGSGSSCGGSLT